MAKSFAVDTGGTLTTGLISYYKCSSLYDYYSTNHGTGANAPTFTSGKISNALTLASASSQYVSLPNAVIPWGDTSFSISMWIKHASTTGAMAYLMNDDNSTKGLYLYHDGTKVRFIRKSDNAGVEYTYTRDTNWHHWVFWKDGTNAKIYLDGSQVATNGDTTSQENPTGSPAVFLGAYNINGTPQANFYFNGQFDEVGIWSKALSTTEIADLYNAGSGQTMTQTTVKRFSTDTDATLVDNLISYYKLEDVNDYWGSNTLTNTGTVTFASGKVNNAADFGSSNSTKRLNYTSTNMGIDGGACSVSCWFNPSSQPVTNGTFVLVSQAAGNSSKVANDIYYVDVSGTKKIQFIRNRFGVVREGPTYDVTLSNSTWYHLVYTYDGTNVRGYLNGSLVGGPTAASGNGANNYGLGLGIGANSSNLNQGNTSGLIDEVGVWGKVLSSTEVADLYNSGNGQTMIDSNIKSWNGLARASIKSVNSLAIASVKSINGLI